MPPLPSNASIWYWPSSTVSTIDAGSASRTSPSTAQKLTLSSYFALQAVQYFIRNPQIAQTTQSQSLPNLCNLWIDLAGVFLHHSVAVVLRRERLDRAFHHLYPLARNSVFIATVINGHDFRLQCAVQRFGIEGIDLRDVVGLVPVSNREAVRAVVTFQPPAIENREIQAAVDSNLLTTGSRRFLRPSRHFSQTSTDWTNWRAISWS